MKITHDEVRRIARLAHLQFDEEDLDRLRDELDRILTYVEALEGLDTRSIELTAGVPAGPPGAARDDVPVTGLSRDEALSNAPDAHQGHFRVPKVIS